MSSGSPVLYASTPRFFAIAILLLFLIALISFFYVSLLKTGLGIELTLSVTADLAMCFPSLLPELRSHEELNHIFFFLSKVEKA